MRTVVMALAVLVALLPREAAAQPAATQADALFQQAKALLAAGKTAEACAAFDASQRLDQKVTTLLNQANCREKNGQLATAWGLFIEVERQTRGRPDLASRQMQPVAAERAASLHARLSTLVVRVPDASRVPGLEVRRDGVVLDPATWGQALPLDGGTYAISASAPGGAAWTQTIVLGVERDAKELEVPLLAVPPPVPVPVPRPVDPTPVPPVPPPADSIWSARRKLAVSVATGGAVALVAGVVVGISAERKQRDAEALCPQPACDAAVRANELLRAGHDRAIAANVAFAVGGAAVLAAGVLWLTGAPESRGRIALEPVAAPGQLGLLAVGRF